MCAAARPARRPMGVCMRTGEQWPSHGARGFTYLWLLFVLALGGAALAMLGVQQQTQVRRELEAELRFRGQAIAEGLARYAERTPIGSARLPQRLEDLLDDRRFPKPQRHLRQLYTDPFTGRADWVLIWGEAPLPIDEAEPPSPKPTIAPAAQTGIVGVRSAATRHLLSTAWLAAQGSGRKPDSAGKGRPAMVSDLLFLAPGLGPQDGPAKPPVPAVPPVPLVLPAGTRAALVAAPP